MMIAEQHTTMTDATPANIAELPDDIVNALAVSPRFARDSVCFAARNSGLYRSDDAGQSWQFAYRSLLLDAPLTTTAVVVSPEFDTDHTVFAGAHGGVLRSLDGGATWQITMLPSPPPLVTSLAISPNFANDGVVFAGTLEDGVFRSDNRGSSWAAWNFGLLDLNVLSMAISPTFERDEMLFAGTGSGLFRSTNGGRAWREVDLPVEFTAMLSLAIASVDDNASMVFAGTEDHGLLASDNGGRAWRRLGEDVLQDAVNSIVPAPRFSASPDMLVLLSDMLVLSRDAGESWAVCLLDDGDAPGIAAVAAPLGLGPGAPLLVGLIDGGVLRQSL